MAAERDARDATDQHDENRLMIRVELRQGELEGVGLGDGIVRFMNVPYAEPPVGELRFGPAVPRRPRPGIWDATRPGPTPPQTESWSPLHQLAAEPGYIPGDDYLNLNIFTPGLEGSRPVAVYIHGGGWREGNGALRMYDGRAFARDGIVLVSINYRVGPEGFLYFEEGHRNLGYWDQVAALRWVQENIAAFGGDPGRVTIFGQSAGGAAVTHLVSMPQAAGLFRGAINHSGPAHMAVTSDQAMELATLIARNLGVAANADGFRSVTPLTLVRAAEATLGDVTRIAGSSLRIAPVLDPDHVPWHASHELADAFPHPVSVMGGFTAEEMLLFTWDTPDSATESDVIAALGTLGVDPAAALEDLRTNEPTLTYQQIARKLTEYEIFVSPGLEWLKAAQSHGLDAWGFEFGWRSTAEGGRPGAYHVLDIPFVFDNLRTAHAMQMTGPGAPQKLADAVHGEWVQFMTEARLDRPRYSGPESLRWLDTQTREQRNNTTALFARVLGGG